MFGWFKKKSAVAAPVPNPESKWKVTLDEDLISVQDESGQIRSVRKNDLGAVVIATNDSGPWGADVWWLLFDSGKQQACSFPQGAEGEEAAMDFLFTLPSFDYKQMVDAMGSTDEAFFPVWEKPESESKE